MVKFLQEYTGMDSDEIEQETDRENFLGMDWLPFKAQADDMAIRAVLTHPAILPPSLAKFSDWRSSHSPCCRPTDFHAVPCCVCAVRVNTVL